MPPANTATGGGNQRPPETGRIFLAESCDEADHPAEEKQPTEHHGNREPGDWRQRDRGDAEDHQDDPLDQEGAPMIVQRAAKRCAEIGLVQRHGFLL
jgi:hypothetical protein